MPVLHRLPRAAGRDIKRTVGAAYVRHGEPAAALPLRPQPRRHGRPAASGPAQVGAHTGGHVHIGKVSAERSHVSANICPSPLRQIMERSRYEVEPKP